MSEEVSVTVGTEPAQAVIIKASNGYIVYLNGDAHVFKKLGDAVNAIEKYMQDQP